MRGGGGGSGRGVGGGGKGGFKIKREKRGWGELILRNFHREIKLENGKPSLPKFPPKTQCHMGCQPTNSTAITAAEFGCSLSFVCCFKSLYLILGYHLILALLTI